MMTQLMTAMKTSISEVMGTMFFLPVEHKKSCFDQSDLAKDPSNLACALSFSGQVAGHVRVLVPETLAKEMAENFMGEPADTLTREHIEGTVTELLNMVCGNALSKVRASMPFDLGIPELISQDAFAQGGTICIIDAMLAQMALCIQLD